MTAWQEESSLNKAKCIAHYLHASLRESYASDMALSEGDKSAGSSSNGNGTANQSMHHMLASLGL
jgi:hypothetical protein